MDIKAIAMKDREICRKARKKSHTVHIEEILKLINTDISVSRRTVNIINSVVRDVIGNLATEAVRIAVNNSRDRITSMADSLQLPPDSHPPPHSPSTDRHSRSNIVIRLRDHNKKGDRETEARPDRTRSGA